MVDGLISWLVDFDWFVGWMVGLLLTYASEIGTAKSIPRMQQHAMCACCEVFRTAWLKLTLHRRYAGIERIRTP